jgi:hypothetical protein
MARRTRRGHRKNSRRNRRGSRRQRGGQAPLDWSNPGPMKLNLAQGQQFAQLHAGQHGGMAPYPGGVTNTALPQDLVASAHLLPLQRAFQDIAQYGPEADRQAGGRRRGTRRGSRKGRKGRKGSRRQRGGQLVRWGGPVGGGRRRMYGGSRTEMSMPMDVAESSKMLIPPSLQAQAGLNPEWKLAENPMAFAPQ